MTEMEKKAMEKMEAWLSTEKLQAAELKLEQAKAKLAAARAEYEALRAESEWLRLSAHERYAQAQVLVAMLADESAAER